MKQFRLTVALACALLLAGCGGVSQSDYDAVCGERDALRAQVLELLESAQAEPEKLRVRISGQFSAMVRELIPDYVVDGVTPMAAVVTEFQSGPFVVFLGDLAQELEAGEVYVFELAAKEVELVPGVSYAYDPMTALSLYGLKISGVRPADTGSDSEWGLQPKGIEFEEIG